MKIDLEKRSNYHQELDAIQAFDLSYLHKGDQQSQTRGIVSLTFRLAKGKIYAILGSNGAGKTTLFNLLSGRLFPQQGQLYFHEHLVTYMPLWKRARLGLGYLSQAGTLVENMSVEWNLRLAQEAISKWPHKTIGLLSNESSLSGPLQKVARLEVLEQMGVKYTLDQPVCSLSGGERRRVEMARLILTQPSILILDEPFAALDESGCHATLDLIEQAKAWGAAVLVTDHQKKYLEEICQEIIYLEKGQLSVRSSF